MQNIKEQVPELIKGLLQASSEEQRFLIERYYTKNCRLTHALVIAENREEIVRISQFWRFFNARLTPTIEEISKKSFLLLIFSL